jgi:hypothetical protein
MPQIKSALYAAIGDHSLDGPNAKVVNLRLPETLAGYVAALADQNGRTVAEEIRAALRVSVLLTRLNVVLDDELQAGRRGASDGILGLQPETATRYAATLREQLADEWRQMLPGAHRRYQRQFPLFLWTAAPVSEFTITIEVSAADLALLAAVTADIDTATPTPHGELEFKVAAETLAAASDAAWHQLGDLREAAGLPRLADGQPRGFGYRS